MSFQKGVSLFFVMVLRATKEGFLINTTKVLRHNTKEETYYFKSMKYLKASQVPGKSYRSRLYLCLFCIDQYICLKDAIVFFLFIIIVKM